MPIELETIFPALPATTRGRSLVLGPDPKQKNFLYVVGNTVVIRDIENTSSCDVYTQHAKDTTSAMYAPSGFYIASGDLSGKLRIWDTVNKEHILKYEYQPLSGAIKDICWSEDSKRIAVAGEGREKFGNVFLWDTGSSTGQITGHSKSINSIDMRKTRPFRIATGSEDLCVGFFEGPPFKFNKTIQDHTNFVNSVRYAPDGSTFASGSADSKAFIYDGKTGDVIRELGSPKAHDGGIYGVCYSPDSKSVLTVSGDKTARIFDVESGALSTKFTMGSTVNDMQLGCLWSGDNIISVSLSGAINFLDVNNPTTPKKILQGHNKAITALAISPDKKTAYSAGFDGKICFWDTTTGDCNVVEGKGHTNQVQHMVVNGDTLVTVGMDDTVRFTSCADHKYGESVLKLDSQPQSCDAVGTLTVVSCLNEIYIIRDCKIVNTFKVNYQASRVSIHPNQNEIAVGGTDDKTVHVYDLVNNAPTEKKTISRMGDITDVKYSPDGSYLAVADASRRVSVYKLSTYELLEEWVKHAAKITCIAWSPNSKFIASGGLDTHLSVYNVDKLQDTQFIHGAHPMNYINGVGWTDNNRLMTAGKDCCIRVWNVTPL